ncbi:MAG: ROK family protein [Candidatus Aadella gelida]|nr:ROK family protein [Candidatus Aadella gelida]
MRDFVVKEERLSEKERRNLGILDSIRRKGEISRADISKITDLNIVTVSNYVAKYIKDKIILETGLDISTGGRRPELLKINKEYGYSLGIDLGAPQITSDSNIVGVIMDLSGRVIAKETLKKEKYSFDKLSSKVLELSDILVQKSGIDTSKIRGIGVGIWGVLDRYRGMVRYAVEEEQIVSYTNLVDQLRDKFNVPVVIEHDATLAAFGEKWSGIGASTSAENLVFLCADSSCGLIIRDEIYFGASKSAGELNINPPLSGEEADKDKCWSSYEYGCIMRSRGIDLGIADKVKQYIKEHPGEGDKLLEIAGGNPEDIDLKAVIEGADKDDKVSKKALEEAGNYLGAKIAFLINLFNPEVVVIGRGIEKTGNLFFSAVRKSVRKWAYEESVKVVKILPSSLGEDVVATGAAAFVIQNIFAQV